MSFAICEHAGVSTRGRLAGKGGISASQRGCGARPRIQVRQLAPVPGHEMRETADRTRGSSANPCLSGRSPISALMLPLPRDNFRVVRGSSHHTPPLSCICRIAAALGIHQRFKYENDCVQCSIISKSVTVLQIPRCEIPQISCRTYGSRKLPKAANAQETDEKKYLNNGSNSNVQRRDVAGRGRRNGISPCD